MSDDEIRAALKRHWTDIGDQETVHEIYHEDAVLEFPQSGERLVGLTNIRAMREAYPAEVTFTVDRIRGGGNVWVGELRAAYDGGAPMYGVSILTFRDGKVAHEAIYFGEPWEPPAWRAQWVEQTT